MSKAKKKADPEHRELCDRLERLTGGCLSIMYAPNDYLEGDPGSEGHLYSGWISGAVSNSDVLDLDDRGDIEKQIVEQLEMIGEFYRELARHVDSAIDLANADSHTRVRHGQKTVAVTEEVSV